MNSESKRLLGLAGEMLEDSKLLLRQDRHRSAINRAYYAVFDAAKAALIEVGSSPKTHSGTISEFGQKLVNTETVGKRNAAILRKLFELRQESDYSTTYVASEEETETAIDEAVEFVEEIKSALKN